MRYYSFRWLADRVGDYGWNLCGLAGTRWWFMGKGLPHLMVDVEERWIEGRRMLVIEKRCVDMFDECTRELFHETIYDGHEESFEGD